MTKPSSRTTATEALAAACARALLGAALLLAGAGSAWAAQVVGTIAHLSGPLLDRKADGSTRALATRSEIENGDTLVTEKNTYAQIRFIDNGEITLRPGTTFRVENFAYDAARPEGDSAAFNLVKGGLRSITGLLGKRNKEKFQLKTPGATIGIRGTTFIVQWVDPALPSAPAAPAAAPLVPGLYVQVLDGMINVSNAGGQQNYAAGQFGYVPGLAQPPVVVPNNPGVQFTPPPTFSSTAGGQATTTAPATVDCVVR